MQTSEMKSRTNTLTGLCIVSAIAGLMWIVMLLTLIILALNGNIPAGLFPGLVLEYLQTGYWFVIIEIILAGTALLGVYRMWQMEKTGFYIYAISKIIIYFLPVMHIGNHHLTFPGLLLTSALIILYGIHFYKNST